MADQLRADARSNRDQILAAAQIVFREQGVDVPMKEIADQAGVGVGTLYRRFPDRGALISAAAQAYLQALADLAATAAREEAGAWPALRRFLRECAELRLGATAAAIEPALHADIRADPQLSGIRAGVAEQVARLTAQAQVDGELRTDVDAQDVARLMTLQIYVRPDESYEQAVRRTMDIVLDGLRAR
ncbi:TetR/AcrR family transcriptional regulator [Nocardia blacklockiae]|uniref:TetR/AcrR family transcriptional regulator n=1 Tax=Nocardia blacklockiae TaxID=480036 RepID=UPI001893804A|nr:TetR/AcrR family transcriptional regulator [Nocardia blacklockiae]MBF6173346.1 TetR/AcrR family transcriptional regulator [Nocardia blacklockiae]